MVELWVGISSRHAARTMKVRAGSHRGNRDMKLPLERVSLTAS
jgi:hypothetical protein